MVALEQPVPLHAHHFYAIKIEYFIPHPIKCKVFLMSPLNLCNELDDAFMQLAADESITDICGFQLRREVTSN